MKRWWVAIICQGSKVDFYEVVAPSAEAAERRAREKYGHLIGPHAQLTAEAILERPRKRTRQRRGVV